MGGRKAVVPQPAVGLRLVGSDLDDLGRRHGDRHAVPLVAGVAHRGPGRQLDCRWSARPGGSPAAGRGRAPRAGSRRRCTAAPGTTRRPAGTRTTPAGSRRPPPMPSMPSSSSASRSRRRSTTRRPADETRMLNRRCCKPPLPLNAPPSTQAIGVRRSTTTDGGDIAATADVARAQRPGSGRRRSRARCCPRPPARCSARWTSSILVLPGGHDQHGAVDLGGHLERVGRGQHRRRLDEHDLGVATELFEHDGQLLGGQEVGRVGVRPRRAGGPTGSRGRPTRCTLSCSEACPSSSETRPGSAGDVEQVRQARTAEVGRHQQHPVPGLFVRLTDVGHGLGDQATVAGADDLHQARRLVRVESLDSTARSERNASPAAGALAGATRHEPSPPGRLGDHGEHREAGHVGKLPAVEADRAVEAVPHEGGGDADDQPGQQRDDEVARGVGPGGRSGRLGRVHDLAGAGSGGDGGPEAEIGAGSLGLRPAARSARCAAPPPGRRPTAAEREAGPGRCRSRRSAGRTTAMAVARLVDSVARRRSR